jgi:hypothetical protein
MEDVMLEAGTLKNSRNIYSLDIFESASAHFDVV